MKTERVEILDSIIDKQSMRTRVEFFARLLDESFIVPGTRIRFGWDNVIGLIPGVGDLVSMTLALYLIVEGARAGAPASVISRMVSHIIVDTAAGAVPVVGDLFDVAYKSNRRNARLLIAWVDAPTDVTRRSRLAIAALIAGCFTALFLIVTLGVLLALWIFHKITA